MRPVSFIISLCLHAGIIALALFLPQGEPPVDLTGPVIDIGIYTIGSPGTAPTRMAPAPAPAVPQGRPEAPRPPQTPPQAQPDVPKPPQDTSKPEPAPVKPEPVPVPPPKPEPAPEKPEPDPVPIPQPDAPKAPEPPKPETPKPPDKPAPETAKPGPSRPSTPARPGRPAKSADDILREALGDLKGQTPDPDSTTEGGGPGGQGGDGIGIVGSYMQSLVSRIKPNWEAPPRADRRNPTALVSISIGRDGTILEAAIVTPSGDAAFDGSVLKAVYDTVRVEPPPTPDLMRVQVPFAYEAIRR